MDVLVISDASLLPGCPVRCKLIGGFKAEQISASKKLIAGKRNL